MKKFMLPLILLSNVCLGQNIVPNSGFELTEIVPCGWSDTSTEFDNSIVDWNSPTNGTPDIQSAQLAQSCWNNQPNSVYTGPGCSTGSQVPHSGNNFAGFYTYTPGVVQREYLQVQLSAPMVPGNLYYVKLYVSAADRAKFTTNNIGVGFSTSSNFTSTIAELGYMPEILFTDVISDETNWVLLMDSIVPTEAYEYIIIGNFLDDASTITVSGSGCIGGAYYYCDDICISTDTTTCGSSVGINELLTPEKKLIRIVDTMGIEREDKPNSLLIYIYSDGTTEKVFSVE